MAQDNETSKPLYDQKLEQIEEEKLSLDRQLDQFKHSATKYIPELAELLRDEKQDEDGAKLSNDDIRRNLLKDTRKFWEKDTIRKAFPEWLVRDIEIPADPEAALVSVATDGSTVLEGGSASGSEDAEDPVKAQVRDLKEQLKTTKKEKTDAERNLEKANRDLTKLTEQIVDLKEKVGTLTENKKLMDKVSDLYNKDLDALEFTFTQMSIKKLEEFGKETHSLTDKYTLVIKLTGKDKQTIDSIEKVKAK